MNHFYLKILFLHPMYWINWFLLKSTIFIVIEQVDLSIIQSFTKKLFFCNQLFYYSIEYRIYSCMKNRILSYSYSLQRKSTPRWWWNNHGSPSSSIHGYSDPRRKSSRGIFHHRFSVNNSAINTFSTVCSFFFHSLLFS